jgi:acetyltransferase-like isoleucine patch superfamily enzyme
MTIINRFINKIFSNLGYLLFKSIPKNKLICTNRIIIKGVPKINIIQTAKIIIGNKVVLNSQNDNYHLNMHSRVKLMADRENAVIEIGANTRIHGSCIHAYKKISIGRNCLIAANCQIFDGNGHDLSFPDVENRIHTIGDAREIVIEDNVWIGANCIILPGVRIGFGSVISAGSIVHKDIPPMCLAGGNPVEIIKQYEEKPQ